MQVPSLCFEPRRRLPQWAFVVCRHLKWHFISPFYNWALQWQLPFVINVAVSDWTNSKVSKLQLGLYRRHAPFWTVAKFPGIVFRTRPCGPPLFSQIRPHSLCPGSCIVLATNPHAATRTYLSGATVCGNKTRGFHTQMTVTVDHMTVQSI